MYVIGAFGFRSKHIDGQTYKTRLLKDCLESVCKSTIQFTDTSDLRRRPHTVVFDICRSFSRNNNVFILPAKRGLKYLLPLYTILKSIHKNDIRYIVIGGWLPFFLKKNPRTKKYCEKLDGIYVETYGMAKALEALGMKNIYVLPNFRVFDCNQYKLTSPPKERFSLVFFSRIMKEKGIEKAIDAVSAIASRHHVDIVLDIYGDIQGGYEERFDQIMKEAPNFIQYLGFLSPDPQTLYPKLSSYDAMLFPSAYGGEGFPGVVIDAFISGLPVIASDWRYNPEIISDNVTGKLFALNEPKSLENILEYYLTHRDELMLMRVNCTKEARKYNAEQVVEDFLCNVGLHPNQKHS